MDTMPNKLLYLKDLKKKTKDEKFLPIIYMGKYGLKNEFKIVYLKNFS